MLDTARLEYDSNSGQLTYHAGLRGKALLHKVEGDALSKLARAGDWEGKHVKRVVVLFGDQDAATYNADAMAYLGLVASGPDGEARSDAKFPAREDFGIAPDKRRE